MHHNKYDYLKQSIKHHKPVSTKNILICPYLNVGLNDKPETTWISQAEEASQGLRVLLCK